MKKLILITVMLLMLNAYSQGGSNSKPSMSQRLMELSKETDQKAIDKKLKDLQKSNDEEDYILAYKYYSSKDMTKQAEETKTKILQKFPEGYLVQQEAFAAVEEVKDLNEKDRQFMVFYNKYPKFNYGFMPFYIGKEFAGEGNEAKMIFYGDITAKVSTDSKGNALAKEYIYASMATAMVQANPEAAVRYLKYGVTETKKDLDAMLAEPNPNEKLQRTKNNYFSMLTNYLYALSNGQNSEEAYEIAKKSYNEYTNDPATDARTIEPLEKVYIYTLVKTNRYKEALPLIEKTVKKGDTDKKTLENLKKAYTAVNSSDADYASYETKILAEQKEAFKEEVAKMAINEPGHEFQLKDVDGNLVKLSDYKGKVVVIDFWATWCGPCKASFPTMQKAVNKYINDPQVQFLFLHTWEKKGAEPTQAAKKYITDNNYTFKVLMDLRDSKTGSSAVAMAYKVDGIPAKFILDAKGNIRFSTSGFSDDADKAIEELSNMIEFAKKS
jgi:thiol-disulfide isomerase/thioredoxin